MIRLGWLFAAVVKLLPSSGLSRSSPRLLHLTLLTLLALCASCSGRGKPAEPARLDAIVPGWGFNGESADVELQGAQFTPLATLHFGIATGDVSVDDRFLVFLGATQLDGVTWQNARTLRAVVPAGLPVGIYDARIVDPYGVEASRAGAFEVRQRTDAGIDAGSDAGRDAGSVDGGTAELCANRVDDDGDLLVDCADPDCPVGTACDDGDSCSKSESCSGGSCLGGIAACAGPSVACYQPAGCDAGICLSNPAPARSFCDGGQCDGVGRCAPFCDPTRAALAACYQFEGVLTDGSQHGNNGSGPMGTFGPGSRKQGWVPGAAGVLVAASASLDCSIGLTLEAWVRLTTLPGGGNRYGVIDKEGQYGLFIGAGGDVRCSGGLIVPPGGALTTNAWHHVACVFDGLAGRAYLNGVQVGFVDTRLADGGVRALAAGTTNSLAVGQNSPSGDVLQGSIDGVRIWCEAHPPADFCAVLGECG